jgi:hypothetical protein
MPTTDLFAILGTQNDTICQTLEIEALVKAFTNSEYCGF